LRLFNFSLLHLKLFYILLLFLLQLVCRAQVLDSTSTGILQPSLNDIISLKPEISSETKVTIANLVETNVYEAPNVISIITDEDIKELGYRDLLDVLNTIPGINIANDVQNGTSIGVRGMWAEEGKILFMINGLVMNDMSYGSIVLGHRFPLINIKRIEIIRGAGSSMYGGLAALGVINIITKNGQEINGHLLNITGGASNKKTSRGLFNYNYGGALINGVELSFTGLINKGNRSNKNIQLPDSSNVNFFDSSAINNVHFSFAVKYKKISFRQLYEDYNFQGTYESVSSLMRTGISNLKYDFAIKKLRLSPFFEYKWQLPWNIQYGDPLIYDKQNLSAQRQTYGFSGGVAASKFLSFTFGSQFYYDAYRYFKAAQPLNNGKLVNTFNGYVAYAEATLTTKYCNLNIGGRFDQYAYFKPNLLPRMSLTKSFKYWHYKVLYGKSFKIPPLQNINLDVTGTLVPEKVTDIHAELGLHSKWVDLTGSVFNTTIDKLIVYGIDEQLNESYINNGNVNTQGFELSYKMKFNKFTLKGNYSNYGLISSTATAIMVDTSNAKRGAIAFPKHKMVTTLSYKLNANNSLCLNYVFNSKKYSVQQINSTTGEYGLIEHRNSNQLHLIYQCNGLFNKVVDINVGIYNLLNENNLYVYAYSQGYYPVAGMGREFLLTVKLNM
jgi:outer membrane cobalamin receptor